MKKNLVIITSLLLLFVGCSKTADNEFSNDDMSKYRLEDHIYYRVDYNDVSKMTKDGDDFFIVAGRDT